MPDRRPRPRVAINIAISADGKVNTARRTRYHFSGPHDKVIIRRLRAEADAVLWGSGTLLVDDPVARTVWRELVAARRERGASPHPLNVLVTASCRVPMSARFFAAAETAKVVFTSAGAPPERVRQYQTRAEVVARGDHTVDLPAALEWLAGHGVGFALVEGGPRLNFSLLEAGLVDELYVTIEPLVIGGASAPTLADGPGLVPGRGPALRLIGTEQHDDEIFLRYAAGHAAPAAPGEGAES